MAHGLTDPSRVDGDSRSIWDERSARWRESDDKWAGGVPLPPPPEGRVMGRTLIRIPNLAGYPTAQLDPERYFGSFIGWWARFGSKGPAFDGQNPVSVRAWMIGLLDDISSARSWIRSRRADRAGRADVRTEPQQGSLLMEAESPLSAELQARRAGSESAEPDFAPVALAALRALAELAGEQLRGVPSNLPSFARAVRIFIADKCIAAVERAIEPTLLAQLSAADLEVVERHPLHGRSIAFPMVPSEAERALRVLCSSPGSWFTVAEVQTVVLGAKKSASISNTIGNAMRKLAKRLAPVESGDCGNGHVERRKTAGSTALEYRWIPAESPSERSTSAD